MIDDSKHEQVGKLLRYYAFVALCYRLKLELYDNFILIKVSHLWNYCDCTSRQFQDSNADLIGPIIAALTNLNILPQTETEVRIS